MADASSQPNTPTKREGEKAELRALNQRLEYYIIRQRQRESEADSMARELEDTKQRYEAEIAALRAQHEKDLTALQQARQLLLGENSRLVEANTRQESMIAALTKELADQEKARANLTKRLDQVLAEAQDLKTRAFSADERARQHEEDRNRLSTELQAAKLEIESLRRRLDDALPASRAWEDRFKKLEIEWNRERTELRKLVEDRDGSIAQLLAARMSLEEEYKRRLAEELERVVRERHDLSEREKADLLAREQANYASQIAGLEARIKELQAEIGKLLTYSVTNRELDKQLAEAKLLVIDKEKIIEGMYVTHHLEIRRLQERIEALNRELALKEAALNKQGVDYDKLHDAKVALDLEIKAYRLLLENEEDRHKNKRTRASMGPSSSSSSSTTTLSLFSSSPSSSLFSVAAAPAPQASFAITDIDLEQGFIQITNDGPSAASPAGWSLRSLKKAQALALPKDVVAAGGQFRVWLHLTSAPIGANLWTSKDGNTVYDPAGDEIALVDSNGSVQTQVQISEEDQAQDV